SATTTDTPTGPLTLVAEGERLVAGGFTDRLDDLRARLDPLRRAAEIHHRGDLGDISRAMAAYLEGDVTALDGVPVEHAGTEGQRRVWAALRKVPAGTTVSYGQLARMSGSPSAVRAAASACGRNLIAPFVPCHRVVRRDGGLGGYAYGLDTKRWLLDHERASTR
ncbi:MAG: methylated-DNA--[protein]-cysteine S-methyltransferase, partial [Euzebyales bacterium]|nr:methylated-DNA--[protein]-cysteine S-methyltransferase [Euzebyales bacterium]